MRQGPRQDQRHHRQADDERPTNDDPGGIRDRPERQRRDEYRHAGRERQAGSGASQQIRGGRQRRRDAESPMMSSSDVASSWPWRA
jgi:hypothetical protein